MGTQASNMNENNLEGQSFKNASTKELIIKSQTWKANKHGLYDSLDEQVQVKKINIS